MALTLVAPTVGSAEPKVEFNVLKLRYLESEPVDLLLYNNSDRRIELFGGTIRRAHDREVVTRLRPKQRYLRPGSIHEWTWNHESNAGAFIARFRTSEGRFGDSFEIGGFFELGFRCEDTGDCAAVDKYVIFVREEKPLRQLREDLQRPVDERRIVSGIVSRAKKYNENWSYTMHPGSIILGDVFIEVCDGHPDYIENNRKEWMGERWCPWSSYVASEGR